MADLSDVTAYLAQQAFIAVYPNGTGSASVAGMDCRIFEGWPLPDQLDNDLTGFMMENGDKVKRPGGVCANVSIFPMLGQGAPVPQIQNKTRTISQPTYGLTFTVVGNTLTVSGQPAAGEYLTIIADDEYVFSRGGATTQAILAALLADAQAAYPQASATSTSLTVPGTHILVVRQGGVGKVGRVIHRQKNSIMVTVWAPNQIARAAFAKAIDVQIKQTIVTTLSDTSQIKVTYNRTNTIDEEQSKGIYRRDLVFDVEYATLEIFDAYVITSTQVSIINLADTTTIATAVTGGDPVNVVNPSLDFSDPDDSQYIPEI
ncbi:hypothetical protein [Bradyrhizobium sp. Tv2a-2]|uniref:hypothetical protein n=1 Tax=Bradyrhizobium sp. Tv2a-2 TaxID=113395 RepID=UPI00041A9D0B|nr:hypothetical protein [Bradyrhizobium sp. Tv2a-2]